MRELDLYGTVAAVVSLCDSINYITEFEDLVTTFKLVNNYLDPGGIFVFDLKTIELYRSIGESVIAEDREDCSFIWDNYFDEEDCINEYMLSIFVKGDDNRYDKFSEEHYQRAYTVEEIKEAREDGVTINCGWGPKEILAENGKVTGIVFKKCLSVINDGKFAPVYDENETMTVECGRLIFAIGQQSVWKDLLKGEDVKFNGPAIELNQVTFQSSKEDIFAGGDVYTGPKFAIDAIAQGKIAAESLHRYVHNGHMETGRNRWQFKQLDTDDILVESYDRGPKQVEGINLEVKDRFKDNTQILTEEQIKKKQQDV